MVEKRRVIYLCGHCFKIAGEPRGCCGHEMIRYDAGLPGDERSKPVMDEKGNLKTMAPVWWVERYAWWIRDQEGG